MKPHLVVLMLLAAALPGCNQSADPKAQTAATAAPTSVETVPVVSRQLDIKVSLPAQLLPYQSVDIYPRVTGFVDSIRVDVGSRVRQGELLVKLSAPELSAQRSHSESAVHAAESQLASVQAKLASDQGTFLHLEAASKTPGVVAENDVLVARQLVEADKGSVAAAEHNVTAAREALRSVAQMESYLTITAPFPGVVTVRNLHPGALTGPAAAGAQPILRIVDTDRLRLVVPIPEAQVAEMKPGSAIDFTVPAYPGETFHAPIARIADDVDLNTRTMHIELDVHNTNGKLAAGSFANVSWPLHRAYPSAFVPTTAVTADQQHSFVIRVRDGKAEWATVSTGQSVNNEIEVFGDIHPGDQVIRIASDAIRNGQPVNAKPAKQS
jgi:RND family efflux transporter MFP subunit